LSCEISMPFGTSIIISPIPTALKLCLFAA
jgi:hypothetical protein